MNEELLKQRTKTFGLQTIKLVESLPRNRSMDVISRQLVRCAVSVGANYRSACRAKSRADFIAKLAIVEEEADEALYWLELLEESNLVEKNGLQTLKSDANDILSIIVASIKTARRNHSAIQNRNTKIQN